MNDIINDSRYRERKFALTIIPVVVSSSALLMQVISGAEYASIIGMCLGGYYLNKRKEADEAMR